MTKVFEDDLYQKTKAFASMYFLCRKITHSYPNNPSNPYSRYINIIVKAYESISSEEKKFINNEFFFQEYPFWWEKSYSYPIFINILNRSMEAFIKAIYENI